MSSASTSSSTLSSSAQSVLSDFSVSRSSTSAGDVSVALLQRTLLSQRAETDRSTIAHLNEQVNDLRRRLQHVTDERVNSVAHLLREQSAVTQRLSDANDANSALQRQLRTTQEEYEKRSSESAAKYEAESSALRERLSALNADYSSLSHFAVERDNLLRELDDANTTIERLTTAHMTALCESERRVLKEKYAEPSADAAESKSASDDATALTSLMAPSSVAADVASVRIELAYAIAETSAVIEENERLKRSNAQYKRELDIANQRLTLFAQRTAALRHYQRAAERRSKSKFQETNSKNSGARTRDQRANNDTTFDECKDEDLSG